MGPGRVVVDRARTGVRAPENGGRGGGRGRALLAAASALVALALLPAAAPAAQTTTQRERAPGTHDVMVVANNWEGTADLVDPYTFRPLKRLNIIPDRQERMGEIMMNPTRLAFFLAIRQQIGEGNDQFVDDGFTSPDGRTVYVSRPSFADVVAIDIGSGQIRWRTPVAGVRSDHMAINADGTRVLVSASTGGVVHAIDTADGRIVGGWRSGDQPHENTFSADGTKIYHASIGQVFTPTDDPSQDSGKGKRVFQIVDANTYEVLEEVDMGRKLEEAGFPEMSSAIRPIAFSPDEKFAYMQISFLHGFIEYDMERRYVRRVANLPITEAGRVPRDQYLLDSAHHGIALDPTNKKLCVAGTMSDYAAIVSRKTFAPTIAARGTKPYWSTNSNDGKHCFVSMSGDDRVSVLSYATNREVASIPVGRHPQRIRPGTVACDLLPAGTDCTAPRIDRARVRPRGSGWALRIRASEPVELTIAESRRTRSGRIVRTRPITRDVPAGTSLVRLPQRSRVAGFRRLAITADDGDGNRSGLVRATYRVGSRSR